MEQGVKLTGCEMKMGAVVRSWNLEARSKKPAAEAFFKSSISVLSPASSQSAQNKKSLKAESRKSSMPPTPPKMNPEKRMTLREYRDLTKQEAMKENTLLHYLKQHKAETSPS